MSKPSPSQNSSVDTICAPGISARERRLPRRAVAADADEDEAAAAALAAASISSSTGPWVHRARYPQPMEKLRLGGMALSNGVLVHGPTAWGAAVRARRRLDPLGLRRQAALRAGRDDAVRARAAAARRGVRRPPRRAPGAARGAVSRSSGRASRPPSSPAPPRRASPAARASGSRRARPSPRSRRSRPAVIALRGGELASYHGAEHISIGTYETGRARHEGARPLRRAPRRPAPAHHGRGQRARCAGARSGPPDGPRARRRRRGRRRGRDLRAGWAAIREHPVVARARASRARAADPRLDGRAVALPSSRSPRPRSPPASRPKRPP